jgi:hydrogenase expression/formation protein HypD
MFDSIIESISKKIEGRSINIMEVCGTHTMAISKYGIRQLLPSGINLISGPGCPVCVTSLNDIDHIIEIIKDYELTVFTFGDLIRVPGTRSSLMLEKSKGKDIRICYSPMDALDFAALNPSRDVMFISIGFETTTPISSVLAKKAKDMDLKNFYIYSANKLVIPALKAIISDKSINIGAFLLPGHVSAVIGSRPYEFIAKEHGIACVISGFGPKDILDSIDIILNAAFYANTSKVIIQYRSVVRPEGNETALQYIYDVFKKEDAVWRGLGTIPKSGLTLKEEFISFDAKDRFKVKKIKSIENAACRCGDVLKGIIKPDECRLFSKKCTPDKPLGPCMVSSEGSCAAYFKYERDIAY